MRGKKDASKRHCKATVQGLNSHLGAKVIQKPGYHCSSAESFSACRFMMKKALCTNNHSTYRGAA